MITENGLGDFDQVFGDGHIEVDYRIQYLKTHINACERAANEGVNLLGYFVWSFTDLLNWLNGYQRRYGLVYVNRNEQDAKDLKRIKKKSLYWYRDRILCKIKVA
jgi:6-phospho-beta-glucosidase